MFTAAMKRTFAGNTFSNYCDAFYIQEGCCMHLSSIAYFSMKNDGSVVCLPRPINRMEIHEVLFYQTFLKLKNRCQISAIYSRAL